MSSSPPKKTVAIIGAGTIGLSFAALHLTKNSRCRVHIFDTRPDLADYVSQDLPRFLGEHDHIACTERVTLSTTIEAAVKDADIVQEQGPENEAFKANIWSEIERHAPAHALFWTSTSGIPASAQNVKMHDKTRLTVVHPYNPPHIMPLLEIVPSPHTDDTVVKQTLEYWRSLGRTPVVLQQECVGFVANRLAFALLREACSLVSQGVVGVQDLDEIVQASMGPRWAVAGPFKSYHAGGGEGGLTSFMAKIGGTVEQCWQASDREVLRQKIHVDQGWQEEVCRQADEAYGVVDTEDRDRKTRLVLQATQSK